jgi:hypothetical protein
MLARQFHPLASKLQVNSIERFKAQCEKGARMSLQLQTEEMPDYLAARFIGPGAAEDIWRQYVSIAEHCKRADKNKLLLDFTEAQGELSLLERYFIGAFMSRCDALKQ